MQKERAFLIPLLGLAIILALGACAPEEEALPDTSANAVWSFLQQVEYRENWDLWPGTAELYQGVEPHGLLLTTYVNEQALEALNDGAGAMPPGSIIVKENFMPDGTYDSATIMYKVPGYNPEHNDWFWAKIAADDSVDAEGRAEGCQACHGTVEDNDYIFTSPLQ